jgi:glutathione synthase/RimK-type ligase-like ATP-grasp enzyme
MILILTGGDDIHADAVEAELGRMGAPVVRFDPARYPAEAELTVRIAGSGCTSAVLHDHGGASAGEIALDAVDAVWVRRPGRPRAPDALAGTPVGRAIEAEVAGVLFGLWELLEVPFVPARPAALEVAATKLRQLALAARLGFEIPDTLVTSDPEAFLDRYAAAPGRQLITKRAVADQRLVTVGGHETGRATLAVRPRDLVDVEAVRLAPILTQPLVDKALEVRATVVGGEVFAAAIHSQETHHTQVDFRRYDVAHTRITPHALPEAERDRCVALTRALGLRYSAIDLIATPDGRQVFLEVNPSGQYLWIERATGLPISRALAELLTSTEAKG